MKERKCQQLDLPKLVVYIQLGSYFLCIIRFSAQGLTAAPAFFRTVVNTRTSQINKNYLHAFVKLQPLQVFSLTSSRMRIFENLSISQTVDFWSYDVLHKALHWACLRCSHDRFCSRGIKLHSITFMFLQQRTIIRPVAIQSLMLSTLSLCRPKMAKLEVTKRSRNWQK